MVLNTALRRIFLKLQMRSMAIGSAHFLCLWEALRELWVRYGEWETLDEFEDVADIWLEMMADQGLEVTPQKYGTIYKCSVSFRNKPPPSGLVGTSETDQRS